jgi:hypothetical protein
MAATLYFDPPTSSLFRGDAVKIAVRLDTDEASEECVNAVDGVISYSDSIIPVDIALGESIFPIWVEAPVINKEARTISFAGGLPNGYCGRVAGDPQLTNKLFEIIFRAPGLQVGASDTARSAEVAFTPQSMVYLNDGLGTAQTPSMLAASFSIADTVGAEIQDPWRAAVLSDTIPPEPFSILLEKSDTSFDGKYYIAFNTSDKQTGISHYEVMEERAGEGSIFSFGAATAPWITVRSPYVVQDQALTSTIYVRAIDKAGNEYVATIAPQNEYKNYDAFILYGIVACLSIVMLGVIAWVVRYHRRRSVAVSSESEELES